MIDTSPTYGYFVAFHLEIFAGERTIVLDAIQVLLQLNLDMTFLGIIMYHS